jgi:hypothetical protein
VLPGAVFLYVTKFVNSYYGKGSKKESKEENPDGEADGWL